ncbi:MAG: ROK family protein [Sphaerochaeta sp.]
MKNTNRFEILQQVYREQDVNRNYITQSTGLSGAAVTKIINGLIDEGFLSETSYFSALRNRRARYLSISKQRFYVIVLCLCRTSIQTAVADISGDILYSEECSMGWEMIDHYAISERLDNINRNLPTQGSALGCVCITPGIRITEESEEQIQAPFVWDIKTLRDLVKEKLKLPLYTENDSNASLLGEMWFGLGKNTNNFVLYNIGRGIGAAACLDGHLLKGFHNSSIEIGHVTINFQGPLCACGNRGCLELYAGLENLKEAIEQFNHQRGKKDSVESIFMKARGGDTECQKFVQNYADMIAEGALILANMFTPEKMLVTTNEADFIHLQPIVQTIKQAIDTRIFSLSKEKIEVEASMLRKKGPILGAIAVAMRTYFLNS